MLSLIMLYSVYTISLFFLSKRMKLYLVKSSRQSLTNFLSPRDVSWKEPERSINSLPARLSARLSEDFGTAYYRTRASEQCTHELQVLLS